MAVHTPIDNNSRYHFKPNKTLTYYVRMGYNLISPYNYIARYLIVLRHSVLVAVPRSIQANVISAYYN